MAAAMSGCEPPVRIRLFFDYPPPGTPACGLCWLLLEPSQVRLVTDLISLIREKFGFSRRAKLSLFLDGALLPPTESARLVRDNDSLRVKLEEVIGGDSYNEIANGFSNPLKKQRKKHQQKLEPKDSANEDEQYRKKRSKQDFEHLSSQEETTADKRNVKTHKKRKNMATEKDCIADTDSSDSAYLSKKLKKREKVQIIEGNKKKKKTATSETKNTSERTRKTFSLSPSQKRTAKHNAAQPNTKRAETSSESSALSSESDRSGANIKQKLSPKTKLASQHIRKPQLASSVKSVSTGKDGPSASTANSKKSKIQASSSDSDSSSEEQEAQQSSNLKSKSPLPSQGTVTPQAKSKTSSSDSDSSESETSSVKKTKANASATHSLGGHGDKQLPAAICGLATNPADSRRGRGRGDSPFWRGPRVRGCRGMIRGRGRGRGENTSYWNYSGEYQKQQQLNETAKNTSVIIQNPVEAPKKDYSMLPLLAAPPQVGEKIAFKLLELTENYTPEVSDYKEGKIISWNPVNKQLELEILSCLSVAKEPGKFDLVYQSADGAETIEYAIPQEKKITESWDALIEPRLIVDSHNNESNTENGKP
uniref:Coilin n=1 Tax=Salvator merianae TaxID=96440 RepID=A0A8D0KN57_SALMN